MINVEKIKPTGLFTNYIYKAIPLAFDESMSYYETLCGLLSYLKDTVIPALNNNADAIIEVQGLITQLQNYVDNYFENLDVQEEINNKLDEMAELGQLTDIIAQYLQLAGVLAYNTVEDMKQADNLVNGSICKTLGYYTINDGGASYYKVRTITNEDIVDDATVIALNDVSLVAILINPFDKINIKAFGVKGDGETDDTTNFYKALNYTNNLFIPAGTYLIDYNNISLKNKTIIGVEKKSILKQNNANIPFGHVEENTVIHNINFDAKNNESNANLFYESILYFGNNENNESTIFKNHDLKNLNFYGNYNTIPLYFNMKEIGSIGGNINNIYVNKCDYGICFKFNELINRNNWVNGQTIEKVWIEDPKSYGFYWNGADGNHSNASYSNNFNDISVELFTNNSTGLHIGTGASTINNFTVYNDISGDTNNGYSVEFEDTNTIDPKFVTTINNSHFEGLINNLYNKLNYKINNTTFYVYSYFGQETNTERNLDNSQIFEIPSYDMVNPDDFISANRIELTNATVEKKRDEYGWYLSIKKVDYSTFGAVRFKFDNDLPSQLGNPEFLTIAGVCKRGLTNVIPQFYTQGTYSQTRRLNNKNNNQWDFVQWVDVSNPVNWNDTQVYISLPATLETDYEVKIYKLKFYVGRGGAWLLEK